MIKGIVYALSACLIWGLVFVIPQFLGGFSSVEVAMGRCSFYGLISAIFFLKLKLQGRCNYSLSVWLRAIVFSLAATFICYTCLVLSQRYCSPAVSALLLGISPITIAFYGNWKQREYPFRNLVLPSALVLLGLVLINATNLLEAPSAAHYGLGVLSGFIALSAWTWYVVANSEFLKSNPHVVSGDWSTLVGVATLFWVAFFGFVIAIGFGDHVDFDKYLTLDARLISYLCGCAVLGLVCSWLGAFLWNRASLHLPVSMAGQLMIFETIFGLLYVYGIDQRIPPQMEFIGIFVLLCSVGYAIRVLSKTPSMPAIS